MVAVAAIIEGGEEGPASIKGRAPGRGHNQREGGLAIGSRREPQT
jgi:hypothetical protein